MLQSASMKDMSTLELESEQLLIMDASIVEMDRLSSSDITWPIGLAPSPKGRVSLGIVESP